MIFLYLTKVYLKDLDRAISQFIWAYKRSKVKSRTVLTATTKEDGLFRILNITFRQYRLESSIIHKPEEALWVDIEQQFCNPVSF